jgi:hypothetical protein
MARVDQPQQTFPAIDCRAASHRPRFSLLSLFLTVAIICFIAAYFGASRREHDALQPAAALEERLARQSMEISQLRAELGELTVTNRTKLHLLQLPTRNEHHWKWRVYLPEPPIGKSWILYSRVGQIPDTGYESAPGATSMAELRPGELTLEAYVHRDQGRPRFVVSSPAGKMPLDIRQAAFEQLVEMRPGWVAAGSGARMELRDPAAGPVELLRLRTLEEVSRTSISRLWRPPDHPSFGFLVWLEEAPPLTVPNDVDVPP